MLASSAGSNSSLQRTCSMKWRWEMRLLSGSIWRSAILVMLYGRLATTFTRSCCGLQDTLLAELYTLLLKLREPA